MRRIIKFKRFSKPHLLKSITRDLLVQFFDRFRDELAAGDISLPGPALPDEAYFGSLARLLMSPEGLPDGLNEALLAIDEMATPAGQEQLELAVAEAQAGLVFRPESSSEEIALQVWLAAPELLASKHNQQGLLRLTAFDYFGANPANPAGERVPPVTAPDRAALEALTANLDRWFARHNRGQQTTRIECYPIDGEYWFLVRHGDAFTRAPKVERQKTEVLHFRPEKDDVIVYSPMHDEIRINARTKGERDLYVEQFGICLRGSGDYFSARKTYTLEPLRRDGADALDAAGIEGIRKITLRELEVLRENDLHEIITREADDVFRCAPAGEPDENPIPEDGVLTRAAFEVLFADSAKPRWVQIRPPNRLKLGRHCDAQRVGRWMSARGFRVNGRV
jgi:hypothetical protein